MIPVNMKEIIDLRPIHPATAIECDKEQQKKCKRLCTSVMIDDIRVHNRILGLIQVKHDIGPVSRFKHLIEFLLPYD